MANIASILIIDDEPINLQVAGECLSPAYNVFLAKSGEEGLSVLEKQSIDLILLDIHMPDMDGFETAKRIAQRSNPHTTSVIYLTADTSEETISRAFDSGAADYIIKPFKIKEMLARVKNRIEADRLIQSQKLLIEHNKQLTQVIEAHVAFAKTDINAVITYVSQSFCELFSCIEGEKSCSECWIGRNINVIKSGNTPRYVYDQLWETIQKGAVFTHEVQNRKSDGVTNWYKVTIAPDIDSSGKLQGYLSFYQNIDDQVRLAHVATTDYLTGLYNRQKFDQQLQDELLQSNANNSPLSVILIDIDHFKQVNDTYGHDIGDAVLRDVATMLRLQIRGQDFLARWGGEEFVILCPNTDVVESAHLAEKIRRTIEQHRFYQVGHKTASFGITQYQKDMDVSTLFRNVDAALYKAKELGRNRVICL